MPRKLKTYLTSIGFFDLAVAAPSMKAALEAWGARRNLFHQGNAEETEDPEIAAATMAQPGVVLRRAVGTKNAFKVDAELPKSLPMNASPALRNVKRQSAKKKHRSATPPSEKTQEAAIIQFGKEKARREQLRAKEEAARSKREEIEARSKARREQAVEKAEAILNRARRKHKAKMKILEKELGRAQANLDAEHRRWKEQSEKLDRNVRRLDR